MDTIQSSVRIRGGVPLPGRTRPDVPRCYRPVSLSRRPLPISPLLSLQSCRDLCFCRYRQRTVWVPSSASSSSSSSSVNSTVPARLPLSILPPPFLCFISSVVNHNRSCKNNIYETARSWRLPEQRQRSCTQTRAPRRRSIHHYLKISSPQHLPGGLCTRKLLR